jgi:hypothetical protein
MIGGTRKAALLRDRKECPQVPHVDSVKNLHRPISLASRHPRDH